MTQNETMLLMPRGHIKTTTHEQTQPEDTIAWPSEDWRKYGWGWTVPEHVSSQCEQEKSSNNANR